MAKFKCNHCQKNLKSKQSLNRHIIQVHGIGEKSNKKCDFCEKSFFNLRNHLKDVHGTDQFLKCHFCQSEFRSQKLLKSHIKIMHEEKKIFMCDICRKEFTPQQIVPLFFQVQIVERDNPAV